MSSWFYVFPKKTVIRHEYQGLKRAQSKKLVTIFSLQLPVISPPRRLLRKYTPLKKKKTLVSLERKTVNDPKGVTHYKIRRNGNIQFEPLYRAVTRWAVLVFFARSFFFSPAPRTSFEFFKRATRARGSRSAIMGYPLPPPPLSFRDIQNPRPLVHDWVPLEPTYILFGVPRRLEMIKKRGRRIVWKEGPNLPNCRALTRLSLSLSFFSDKSASFFSRLLGEKFFSLVDRIRGNVAA